MLDFEIIPSDYRIYTFVLYTGYMGPEIHKWRHRPKEKSHEIHMYGLQFHS